MIINEVLAIFESLDFHHLFYTQLLGTYHLNKFNNGVVACIKFTIWIKVVCKRTYGGTCGGGKVGLNAPF